MAVIRDDQQGKLTKGGYSPTVQAVSDLAAHVTARDNPPAPDAPPAPKESAAPKAPEVDWASSFFSSLGLPTDVVNKVNQIFGQYGDTNAATAAATAYIRGTPWYDQTYPGIKEAFQKGIVSDESGYRNLLNQQTQVYNLYLGRDITSDEYAANLREGASLATVGGRLQGAAYVGAYGNDWRYALGNFGDNGDLAADPNLTALGQEKAGLDTPMGLKMNAALARAQQRLQGVFSGSLATQTGNTRLGGQQTANPDVAA